MYTGNRKIQDAGFLFLGILSIRTMVLLKHGTEI